MIVRALLPAILICVSLTSCGGDRDRVAPAACPTPTPAADTSLLRRFPLEKFGTVIAVEERAGFVGAEAVSTTQIVELFPQIVRTLRADGYTYVGGDNEGFEAELSFVDRAGRSITMILRRRACEGEISVRALLERKVGA